MLRNLNYKPNKGERMREEASRLSFLSFYFYKWGVSLGGAAASADLGGSSKYSNENFED